MVTLPEKTPINEAYDLQKDLGRANIKPYAWVVNQSLTNQKIKDPVLLNKQQSEEKLDLNLKKMIKQTLYYVPFMVSNNLLKDLSDNANQAA